MNTRRVIAVILGVIAFIIGVISVAEADEIAVLTMISLGHLIVGIIGVAVVLAVIPDKK